MREGRESGTRAEKALGRTEKDDGELLFFSDMALNPAGDSLYQLVGNTGEVLAFDVAENGSLSLRDRSGGLPTLGTYGLVVLEDD
ncbi:hypothetical protein ACSEE7_10815 [Halomonas cupida]|uniref:hypothetical protein n=1 Tax=Halomonas cupida TaxID=44933 RepID=UPI003EF50717